MFLTIYIPFVCYTATYTFIRNYCYSKSAPLFCLSPTSPVLRCASDSARPAGPSRLPGFFYHRTSQRGFRSFHFSLPFRLPLHRHHAVIIPLLSEHVANPIPSSPSDFITDLLYACYKANCVVSEALRPPNS